jgi:hypothetical protein
MPAPAKAAPVKTATASRPASKPAAAPRSTQSRSAKVQGSAGN